MRNQHYRVGKESTRVLNGLMARVQKYNVAAAAVGFLGKTAILRRGAGAGALLALEVDIHFNQDGVHQLHHRWPNEEGTPPLILAFSLRGCVESSKVICAEDLIVFAPDSSDDERVFLSFASGDADVTARGFVYAVEEGQDGTRIAWLVFVLQTGGANYSRTFFGQPETIATLAQAISAALNSSAQEIVLPRNEEVNRHEM